MFYQRLFITLVISTINMLVDILNPRNPIIKKYQCGPIAKRYYEFQNLPKTKY